MPCRVLSPFAHPWSILPGWGLTWGHPQPPAAPVRFGDTGTSRAAMAGAWLARQSPACRSVGQVPSCQQPRHARQVVIHRPGSPAPGAKGLDSSHPRASYARGAEPRVPLGCPCSLTPLALPNPFSTYSFRVGPARTSRGTASPPALIASPSQERRGVNPTSRTLELFILAGILYGDQHVPTMGKAAAGEASPWGSTLLWQKENSC